MNKRDLEYIETRLISPCVNASDAHERLRRSTNTSELAEQANRPMYGIQQFTDLCRDIRREVAELVR